MRVLAWMTIGLMLLTGNVRAQETAQDAVMVVGEGQAVLGSDPVAAEEEAIWDAKRNAVERAVGFFLKAKTVVQNFTLERDEIDSRARGFVRNWSVVPGSRYIEPLGNGKILRLKIEASVALLPVIRKLSDIADVYHDLERPRLKIEITGDSPARHAQLALVEAFHKEGFEVVNSGPAEVILTGRLDLVPTVRFGDRENLHGIGESVAACRANLAVQFISTASEETLLTMKAQAVGKSFQSDSDAQSAATGEAAQTLLEQHREKIVQQLLVRWARERQEGHTITVQVQGANAAQQKSLKEQIMTMRGFRKIVAETADTKQYILRFITRLNTRDVRRRLAEIRLNNTLLTVRNQRGPSILCAVSARPRATKG
jgi:hypothetical protein